MIRFYLNRELAEGLGYRLSRWKRWSRDFLPPDPLGGLQSGFARQYHLSEAFQVYLGGHLVADLKFSVAEAQIILKDLSSWISNHYFPNTTSNGIETSPANADTYRIHIFLSPEAGHREPDRRYAVRKQMAFKADGQRGAWIVSEQYMEKWLEKGECLDLPAEARQGMHWMNSRTLYISELYRTFSQKLERIPLRP